MSEPESTTTEERRREQKRRSQEKHSKAKAEYCKRWRDANPGKVKAYEQRYRAKHRIKLAEKSATRARLHPERIKESNRRSKKKRSEWHRKEYKNAKHAVLAAYGGMCVCCGETSECFLTIDHANNDGAEHRRARLGDGKQYEGNGFGIYRWLKKHSYPQDGRFQVLCYNCNCCKQHDPVGHRKAHANARFIDGIGKIDGDTPVAE